MRTHPPIKIETYEVAGHKLQRVAGLVPIKRGRMNSLEASIRPEDYPEPTHDDQRLVVCCGSGTDSVAMLIGMRDRGERPDLVVFADTGSERPHTLRYLNVIQTWLAANDFPPLVIVRRRCPQAGHRSLFEQLWRTQQLPSPAFHQNHSCSISWKLKPQRAYHACLPWLRPPFLSAVGYEAAEQNRKGIREAVGFGSDERGRRSFKVPQSDDYTLYTPLISWGWDRARCVQEIEREGLPQPGKSSCFFCPMAKLCEIHADRDQTPGYIEAALALEERFEESHNYRGEDGYRGLRIAEKRGTWAEWIHSDEPAPLIPGLVATV